MSKTAESMVALVLHELKDHDEVTILVAGQKLAVVDAHVALDFPDVLFCSTFQGKEAAINPGAIDMVLTGYAASADPMPMA